MDDAFLGHRVNTLCDLLPIPEPLLQADLLERFLDDMRLKVAFRELHDDNAVAVLLEGTEHLGKMRVIPQLVQVFRLSPEPTAAVASDLRGHRHT
eukprot:CAMPEP_0170268828 /NCGR_PEP_ID=MMETSP0116_2-20130129/34347_1 /TAXON_ID=400756 /ORGANISM="Durinskia baltica, Strain CSIRO CS-38" /LENGTH=94 /DNA_ID=CAMNT_0010519997 /DNA_START=516 /DNA_END=800 /DNA_ORIENTATION=+